jgi:hypothetical protein
MNINLWNAIGVGKLIFIDLPNENFQELYGNEFVLI